MNIKRVKLPRSFIPSFKTLNDIRKDLGSSVRDNFFGTRMTRILADLADKELLIIQF